MHAIEAWTSGEIWLLLVVHSVVLGALDWFFSGIGVDSGPGRVAARFSLDCVVIRLFGGLLVGR